MGHWYKVHLVLGFEQQEVWGVHAEELQQVEDRDYEVKHGVAEAAHEIVHGMIHHHRRRRIGVPLRYPPMQHLHKQSCHIHEASIHSRTQGSTYILLYSNLLHTQPA